MKHPRGGGVGTLLISYDSKERENVAVLENKTVVRLWYNLRIKGIYFFKLSQICN